MPPSDATRRQEQLEHLAQVHALSQAIASAISAIEENDLRKFETHLAVQETICNRLSGSKGTLSSIAKVNAVAGDSFDAQQVLEFRQAHVALAQANRVYAALLKRASRSAGLIAALYRSHEKGYDRGPFPLPQRHSWSCEA
jgi:hypothetical protein